MESKGRTCCWPFESRYTYVAWRTKQSLIVGVKTEVSLRNKCKKNVKKRTRFPITLLSNWLKSQAWLPQHTSQEQQKQVKYDWLVRVFTLLKPATDMRNRFSCDSPRFWFVRVTYLLCGESNNAVHIRSHMPRQHSCYVIIPHLG